MDLKMNYDSGLGKVIIVLNEKEGKFDLLAQNPYASKVDYHRITCGIKDIETAKIVRDAYIRGLYDGETIAEINKSKEEKNAN